MGGYVYFSLVIRNTASLCHRWFTHGSAMNRGHGLTIAKYPFIQNRIPDNRLFLVAESTEKGPHLSLHTSITHVSSFTRNHNTSTPLRNKQKKKGSTTHILDIPNPGLGVDVLAQHLLDLLAARGLDDDGAAGEGEGGGVV